MYVYESGLNRVETVARPKWYSENGEPVSDAFLAENGYFKVEEDSLADYDRRVWEIEEKPVEEWQKSGSKYVKTYTFTKKNVVDIVERQALAIHAELGRKREVELRAGFTWDFNGAVDFVQCGIQDIAALTPFRIIAQEKVAAGRGSDLVKLRTGSNKIRNITADEAVKVTSAAFAYGEECYAKTWAKKDEVDAVLDAVVGGSKEIEIALNEIDLLIS